MLFVRRSSACQGAWPSGGMRQHKQRARAAFHMILISSALFALKPADPVRFNVDRSICVGSSKRRAAGGIGRRAPQTAEGDDVP